MGEVLMQPMGGGVGSDDVTATKAQVLTGYNTVTTDSDDEVVAGTMPNNGAMNVTLTPSGNGSTNKAVAGGYYSGGTITANGSASYSQGVSDADGRVNTSSASYNSGYTNGANDKQATNRYKEVAVASEAHGWSMGALIADSNGKVTNYGNTSTVNGNYMTIHCGDTCYITARVNGYFIPQGGSRGYYNSGSIIVSTTVAEGHYGAVIAVAVD